MRFLFSLLLISGFLLPPAFAADNYQWFDKVIWINQLQQVGVAYENRVKVLEFPVLTGDDETCTEPGTYVIRVKQKNYYSRKYDTPMPYSIFFNYNTKNAIHEGEVPPPREKLGWATHGCIHVEQPYMKWLYNWAEAGKTVVIITGRRKQN